jgi:hypothetical protein
MTRYLLAGRRPAMETVAEPGLAATARRVVSATAWHRWLRRWGLLVAYGLPRDLVPDLSACLVVRASDDRAAERLAGGWEQVSGYRVTVLPLKAESAGSIDGE